MFGLGIGGGFAISGVLVEKLKLKTKLKAYLSTKNKPTRALIWAAVFLSAIVAAVAITIFPLFVFPENELVGEVFRGLGMGIGIGFAVGMTVDAKVAKKPYQTAEQQVLPPVQAYPSAPIRNASNYGSVIIRQTYSNVDIMVKVELEVIELVVNGMVFAEKRDVPEESSYPLQANVNGVMITVTTVMHHSHNNQLSGGLPTVCLYVNGNLVAEAVRH